MSYRKNSSSSSDSDDEPQAYRKGGRVMNKNKNKNINKNNVNVIIHNHHRTTRRKRSLVQKLKSQATPRPFQPIIGYVSNPSPTNFNLNELMQKLEALKEQRKIPEQQQVRPEILPPIQEEIPALEPIQEEQDFGFHEPEQAHQPIMLSPEAGASKKAPTDNKQVATLLIEQGLHSLLNSNSSINTQKFNRWYDEHKIAFDNGKSPASTTNTKFKRVLDRIDYVRGLHGAPVGASASASTDDEVVGTVSKKKLVKKLAFGGSV
jgi:hypothetical protein